MLRSQQPLYMNMFSVLQFLSLFKSRTTGYLDLTGWKKFGQILQDGVLHVILCSIKSPKFWLSLFLPLLNCVSILWLKRILLSQ